MKKLFLYLLRFYSKTEKERLEVLSLLHEQVEKEYYEQTTYGNVYNAHIEFLIANSFVDRVIKEGDTVSVNMLKNGLISSVSNHLKTN